MPSETVDVPEGADVSIKNHGGEVTVSWEQKESVIVFEADGYEFVIPASEDFEIGVSNVGSTPTGKYEYHAKFDRKHGVNGGHSNMNGSGEYDRDFYFTDIHTDTMYL